MLFRLWSKVFHMWSLPAKCLCRAASIVLLTGVLCACAGTEARNDQRDEATVSTQAPQQSIPAKSPAEQAAVVAAGQVGVPYAYGGSDRSGFDCSGLVQYSYARAGRQLPRTTGGLWQQLQVVSGSDLEVGDVLFFRIEGKMSHVGLYLGQGRFVHAPSSGKTVSIADLDSNFYKRAFIRGGRPR
jgi:cell wall-associated NlpC family hydrolase